MKAYQWTTLPERKVAGTIFAKFDIEKVQIDLTEIEAQFAAKEVEIKKDEKTKKAGPVSILDPKTSQAMSIFLSQFKAKSLDELIKGILSLDEAVFTAMHIDQILKLIPSSDDIQNISDFLKEHDASNLGIPENFALKLNGVPNLQARLTSFKFKYVFPTKRSEISVDIENFCKGCREIIESQNLHKMLELILLVGNFVNGGTNRGNAGGFKLSSLTKITDTKSTDNKSTLMNYLASVTQTKFPDILNFYKELAHVEAASKVNLSTTTAEVASVKKEFATLSKTTESISKANDDDSFQSIMAQFITKATEEIDVLGTAFNKMDLDYKELCDFYGEDTKTDPSEVLGIFLKFSESFEAALKENEAAKMAAEKNAKREAAKKQKEEDDEKRKKAQADKKPGAAGASGAAGEAVVDDLLSNITSGSMFQNRARRAPANPAPATALKLPPLGAKPFALKPAGGKV
jgi:hypothetical protein